MCVWGGGGIFLAIAASMVLYSSLYTGGSGAAKEKRPPNVSWRPKRRLVAKKGYLISVFGSVCVGAEADESVYFM